LRAKLRRVIGIMIHSTGLRVQPLLLLTPACSCGRNGYDCGNLANTQFLGAMHVHICKRGSRFSVCCHTTAGRPFISRDIHFSRYLRFMLRSLSIFVLDTSIPCPMQENLPENGYRWRWLPNSPPSELLACILFSYSKQLMRSMRLAERWLSSMTNVSISFVCLKQLSITILLWFRCLKVSKDLPKIGWARRSFNMLSASSS
jgi:hypothetical protein